MNVEEFAKRVYTDRIQSFEKRGYKNLNKLIECAVRIVPGTKYTKIDVGPAGNWSGKFMIDKNGNIYGIKGYGQVHKGHFYGTLDTVEQWFWGDYYPTKKFDSQG